MLKSRGLYLEKELVPCLVLILMGFLDWSTTVIGVQHFAAVEINPLFAGIVNSSILIFSCIKLLTAALIGLLFYQEYTIEKTSGITSNLGNIS